MGEDARQERQNVIVSREGTAPVFTGRVLLGDKIIGMIEGHQDNDQSTQRVDSQQALAPV
jgi:hypothetical protein